MTPLTKMRLGLTAYVAAQAFCLYMSVNSNGPRLLSFLFAYFMTHGGMLLVRSYSSSGPETKNKDAEDK